MITMLALIILAILIFSPALLGWGALGAFFSGSDKGKSKTDIITGIAKTMRIHHITPEEITAALSVVDVTQPTTPSTKNIARTIFSWLGGIFILAGIVIYIGMFWGSMGSAMRIFITLGVGFMLFALMLIALREGKFPKFLLPICLAQAFMQTTGWFVLIDELFPRGNDIRHALIAVFGVMALQQGLVFTQYRQTIIALITLIFSYSFLHVGLDMLGFSNYVIALLLGASLICVAHALEKTTHRSLSVFCFFIGAIWFNAGLYDFIADYSSGHWAALLTGVSGLLLAYGLQSEDRHPRLIDVGYLLGSVLFYSGLFSLTRGTNIELAYLGITVSMLYICTRLQNRMLLLTTVLAILSFLFYYTEQYFVNSLGWPVALILLGVLFLGVGAIALKVKKKF
jgi:hypothetical protein